MTSSSSASPPPSTAQTAREIKSLLHQLRASSRRRETRPDRPGIFRHRPEDAPRLERLRRIFADLAERGDLGPNRAGERGGDGGEGAGSRWRAWLAGRHDEFVGILAEGIVAGRTTSLRTFCGVVASSPAEVSGDGLAPRGGICGKGNDSNYVERREIMLSERLLNRLLEAALKSRGCLGACAGGDGGGDGDDQLSTDDAVLTLIESEFIKPYRDVQYFVFKGLRQISADLLAELDRVRKRAHDAGKDRKSKIHPVKEENINEVLSRAEINAGLVAENMCRLLMMMDYVPKSAKDLEDSTEFLFSPPVLQADSEYSGGDDVGNDSAEDGGSGDEDDDSAGSDSDSSENKSQTIVAKGNEQPAPSAIKSGKHYKGTKRVRVISWKQPRRHRHAHQEAWLSVLRLPNLPPRTQKRVLQHLSTYVLGVCPSPLRFAEYFTLSFQLGTGGGGGGGSLAPILSLHGLFILMLDHKLEYPRFYDSLYQLMHPRVLHVRHRVTFLRLLSRSLLSNSMLPAYVAAAFCKRLCRLALAGAPPGGALFALALVGNLLRKHGECACLIHRKGKAGEGGMMKDMFREDAKCLAETRALESSLWELAALEKHYHPSVSTLAGALGTEDKSTPMYDIEDFMAHTYKSLFEQEKKRLGGAGSHSGGAKKRKRGSSRVPLTFSDPRGLFANGDIFGDHFKSL